MHDRANDTSAVAPQTPEPQPARSRRAFLTAAMAALGAMAAQSVATAVPAAAANGAAVKAGRTTTATAVTTVRNTKKGGVALRGLAKVTDGTGVIGVGGAVGTQGSGSEVGALGTSSAGGGWGVGGFGTGTNGVGVHGEARGSSGIGVEGVARATSGSVGVRGTGEYGVQGRTTSGMALDGRASGASGVAVYGQAPDNGYGGYFAGKVHVAGTLSKAAGSFLIDHPLDPANRYLAHSFVESPDMLNVYSGSVTLDATGRAAVRLPRYFEALNADHRVQLTAVGAPAPDLHVARKVEGNRFVIAGGTAGQEVFWQVTGVRQDAYARRNRIKVDYAKGASDKGRYLNPEAFGKRRTKAIGHRAARDAAATEPAR